MKKKVLVLFLSVTICGLLGCASPKAPVVSPAKDQPQNPIAVKDSSPSLKPKAAKPVAKKPEIARIAPAAANEKPVTKPAEMKVANAMERNQYLSSILKPLLPPRSTMSAAAAGFKKQNDFIAALHVSRNLGIPFNEIKSRMTAEHDRMSLNESLRDIRPEMTKNLAKAEAHKGEQQAKDDEKLAKHEAKRIAEQEKLAANRK